MRRDVHGILLLDKPAGMTSNGALQRVKRLFAAKKAGHTGSLDPIATGMLPICFGEATKFSQFLLDADKSYLVTARLGVETNTADCEGEVTRTAPVVDVTSTRLEAVLQGFIGTQEQVPPMFSAIKVNGQPLYRLARQGITIEREARTVSIFSLQLLNLTADSFELRVHCSKGTYIRTLVEDIGKQLGCGAHVIALRRPMVKPYQHATMYTLDALETLAKEQGSTALHACLLPVETAVQLFPAIQLSTAAAFYMRMGQAVRINSPADTNLVRLVGDDGRFIGMGEVMSDGRIKPQRLTAA